MPTLPQDNDPTSIEIQDCQTSDQRLSQMVKEKAGQIKDEQKKLMKEKADFKAEIKAVGVDLYEKEGREIIWLEDGICVSEQKAKRDGQAKKEKE